MSEWIKGFPKKAGFYWFISKFQNTWIEPEVCQSLTNLDIKIGEDHFEIDDVDTPMFWSEPLKQPTPPPIS